MRLNLSNNASAVLQADIGTDDTTITVDNTATFPEAPFPLTLNKTEEIVYVIEVDGNTLTVERGQESTKSKAYSIGTELWLNFTAGAYGKLADREYVDDEIEKIPQPDLSSYATKEGLGEVEESLSSHKEKIATESELGHVKAETDEEGNLILPETEIKVDGETVFLNEDGELTTINPYVDDLTDAPGPKKLIAGSMDAGFFGEVPPGELIKGAELASEIGFSRGGPQNNGDPWLKFAYEGKIQFVAKKPFATVVRWNHVEEVDAVYGVPVEINGLRYKVRLLKGSTKDPTEDTGYDLHNSEWNKLIVPITDQSVSGNWDNSDNVSSNTETWTHEFGSGLDGLYSVEDLRLSRSSGTGSHTICQEEITSNSSSILKRGGEDASSSKKYSKSGAGNNEGWRPVLELIE